MLSIQETGASMQGGNCVVAYLCHVGFISESVCREVKNGIEVLNMLYIRWWQAAKAIQVDLANGYRGVVVKSYGAERLYYIGIVKLNAGEPLTTCRKL